MSIRVSAVVCTLNRAAHLQKAIHSLVHQSLPKEMYEIIIVDNGSTDGTKAVVEEFSQFDNLRYIHQPITGLSQARNSGWQNAQGEYIAYMDDDAIACTEWLDRIVAAFETVQPQPASVGGKVTPIWEVERPAWLPKQNEDALALVDWGAKPIFSIEQPPHLVGCNVAYRRQILQECGGFSTSLGRKGTNLLSNDENIIRSYIRKHNLGIYYDPEICVQHCIPAERLIKRWFYRRAFWQGISKEILQYIESGQGRSNWRYFFRTIPSVMWSVSELSIWLACVIVPGKEGDWFEIKYALCYWLGRIRGQSWIVLGQIKG